MTYGEKFTVFINGRVAHHAECCTFRKHSAKGVVEALDSYGHVRIFPVAIFNLRPWRPHPKQPA